MNQRPGQQSSRIRPHPEPLNPQDFTDVATKARKGVLWVCSMLLILGLVAVFGVGCFFVHHYFTYHRAASAWSSAESFLALVKTKQEAYRNRFGSYLTVSDNPSSIPPRGEALPWDPQASGWNELGANPGTNEVQFQFRTQGGTGKPGDTCDSAHAPHRAVCSDMGDGPWFWATAENEEMLVITNNARSSTWRIDKTIPAKGSNR